MEPIHTTIAFVLIEIFWFVLGYKIGKKSSPISSDDIANMGLNATDKLIELGYVKDCTDTDDEDEFEVQDAIREAITEVLVRMKHTIK